MSLSINSMINANSALLCFVIVLYIILDGFTIGVGVIFPLIKGKKLRELSFSTILPFWDGSATWLVYIIAALLLSFSILAISILTSMYLPAILLIFCIMIKVISIEFRSKETSPKRLRVFDYSFGISSILIAFCHGFVIGKAIEGLNIQSPHIPISTITTFIISPMSVICGIAIISAYGFLGTAWLKKCLRQEDSQEIQGLFNIFGVATGGLMILIPFAIIIFAPDALNLVTTSVPRLLFILAIIITQIGIAIIIFKKRNLYTRSLFIYVCLLVALGILAIVASRWPFVSTEYNIYNIVAAPGGNVLSLKFFLMSVFFILVSVTATVYNYYVFFKDGKIQEGKNEIGY